jgi:polyphosphate kinase
VKSDGDRPGPRESGEGRFLNRELSWLEFDSRVLALAEDTALPLLERVKFLAISARNLDEFFQVRVAGLKAQVDAGVLAASPDGRSPVEQLLEIRLAVEALLRRMERVFTKELQPRLAEEGIRFVEWEALGERDRARLRHEYETRIHPALTPLAVDPAHPFPWISNLSLNLAVLVDDAQGERRFARVKVPPVFPRFADLGDGRLLPLEALIAAHLDLLFPGTRVIGCWLFRVTRDADLLVDEGEADDLLAAIESGLHRRLRVNDAARLELAASAAPEVVELLSAGLELAENDVYLQRGLVGLGALWQLYGIDRPDLKDPAWHPVTQPRLGREAVGDFFATLRAGDLMVHHPYDSFGSSVEAFLEQAARDPDVLAIKHTLYRTAVRENRVLRALIQAAQDGKEVVTLVEIKARFDEEANIEWARSLESAGGNVVYGLVGLKTHGKVVLVVRREPGGIRRYCHIGTGNYNPETARVYEDLGLFTASPEIGADVGELFNHLTGCSTSAAYRKLLVAPEALRAGLVARIREEAAAGDGEITIKVNGLSDPELIDVLYEASAAGVKIDLLVRSICCLRPGVPGLSENIRVRSVVGRFLEHSRIFRFGSAARGRRHYIGSADAMTRNLDRRVEVLVPVEEPALRERLDAVLAVNFDPEARAWELDAEGRWRRTPETGGFSTHARFQERARSAAEPAKKPGA